MAKTKTIRARVEPELKLEAEAVLEAIGLSPTEAIRLFYKQVAVRRALPLELKAPNATTRRAIRQARTKKGVIRYRSLDDLKADVE